MDLMMSGDSIEAVNAQVEQLVKGAAARAKANGRKTVKPQDFWALYREQKRPRFGAFFVTK